jgi:tetratricopeptide (TPR) repeat protein
VAEAAIGHYREALRLNADNPEAHFNLALALLRQNNRDEAVAHLTDKRSPGWLWGADCGLLLIDRACHCTPTAN